MTAFRVSAADLVSPGGALADADAYLRHPGCSWSQKRGLSTSSFTDRKNIVQLAVYGTLSGHLDSRVARLFLETVVYIRVRMNKRDAAVLQEIVSMHPSFSEEQESVDELIQFFYDLIRDEPSVLAKFDAAFRERYGYEADL